jgi:hypothetical protein
MRGYARFTVPALPKKGCQNGKYLDVTTVTHRTGSRFDSMGHKRSRGGASDCEIFNHALTNPGNRAQQ